MSNAFDPQRHYDPAYDVRDWSALQERFQHQAEGAFWPVLGARRSGKTWALKALKHSLEDAELVDLRYHGPSLPPACTARVFLLDEAGKHIFLPAPGGKQHEHRPNVEGIAWLLRWCSDHRAQGRILVAALTPAEWAALIAHEGQEHFVQANELQSDALRPLNEAEARKLGSRTQEGLDVVQQALTQVPQWTRNPFLLSLLLHSACGEGPQRSLEAACKRALLRANDGSSFKYTKMVLSEGLNPSQQTTLRSAARRRSADEDTCQLLTIAGLLEADEYGYRIADPVIAQHLPPPIRIHHVSDLHFGPKSALRVDAKDDGPVGQTLARGAGQGPVREDYRTWIASLPRWSRPNLLVVSGDLAEWGLPEEFSAALAWLEEVQKLLVPHPELESDDPKVLLVGGNHDVDWRQTRAGQGQKRHLPLADALTEAGLDWPRPKLEKPPSDDERRAHVRYAEAGLEVALLASSEYGGQIDPQVIKIADATRKAALQARKKAQEKHADSLKRRYGRLDPGLVHDADLTRLRQHEWLEPVRIAVLHHPLSPVPGTTEISAYAGLVNASQVKDALLEKSFCLVLHGHVHCAWIGRESWPKRHGDRTLTIVSAATLGSRETHETHGFNEIRLLRDGRERILEVQAYERKGQGFEADGATVTVEVTSRVEAG